MCVPSQLHPRSRLARQADVVLLLQNGEAPLSSAYGQTTVALYTGTSTVQTQLASLGTVADPDVDTEVLITIDPTWGRASTSLPLLSRLLLSRAGPDTVPMLAADSEDYFIRIQSVAGVDAAGAPLQAFSARFSCVPLSHACALALSQSDALHLQAERDDRYLVRRRIRCPRRLARRRRRSLGHLRRNRHGD